MSVVVIDAYVILVLTTFVRATLQMLSKLVFPNDLSISTNHPTANFLSFKDYGSFDVSLFRLSMEFFILIFILDIQCILIFLSLF